MIGIDSGGSKTRAIAVDLSGVPVGYVEAAGGNPFHNPNFKEALGAAIKGAAKPVGIEQVVEVVSGIAGLDGPDTSWAEEATRIAGLRAHRVHVNDAEIAHFASFLGSSGIVSIQGHGSNIFGITETGRRVLNSDFLHYASGGAVAIGMRLHFALLCRDRLADEARLVEQICMHWNVASMEELWELARRGWDLSPEKARNHMGAFACVATEAAMNGSPLAVRVCQTAASAIAEGIGLVGMAFGVPEIPVALIGSAVCSGYMKVAVTDCLVRLNAKRFDLQEPSRSPLIGAVLMALQLQGVDVTRIDCDRIARFLPASPYPMGSSCVVADS